VASVAVGDETAVAVPAIPYRGIQPYRFVDHAIFFEREEETNGLLSLVVVYRGVMVYGDSGAGKSSLINAGLIAGSREKGFQPERIRVYPHEGAELVVERIAMTDEGDAFLPSLFAPHDDTTPRIVLSTAAFEEKLRAAGSARPLLVFDQFEELVTLFDAPGHEDIQRRIVDLLTVLLRDASLPVKVLFVFREDYLASVKQLLAAAPELIDQSLRLSPPAAEALTTIIRGPFERYPGHFERELSPELAERLRGKLADRFGSGEMSLSEVQTVCLRLWQSDDPGPLLELRGVQGLLEDYLGAELDAFPPELKYPAVALLSGMVTSAGTRNVMSAESLIGRVREEEEEIPEAVLERALERLESESKLVRRERRRDLYLYEITSEFLVPWISRRREELIRARERRHERRKLLLLGLVIGVLLAIVGVVAFLAVWGFGQQSTAQRAVSSEATLVLSSAANLQGAGRLDTALLLGLAANEQGRDADASPRDDAWVAAITTLETADRSGIEATLRADAGSVSSLAFSADGLMLATNGDNGTVRLWDVRTRKQIGRPIHAAAKGVYAVAFSPDGHTLATAGRDGKIRLWDVRSHKRLGRPLLGGAGAIFSIAFSKNGHLLATADQNRTVELWDVGTRQPLGTPLQTGKTPYVVAFSPNGRTLASAGADGSVRLWNTRTDRQLGAPLPAGPRAVYGIAFSPDGRTLASGGQDGSVRIWSVRTHKQLGPRMLGRTGHRGSLTGWVASVAFSPNGSTVAAAQDGFVRLWDVRTHKQLGEPIQADTDIVYRVAFSPDGTTLATADGDGTVRLWSARPSGQLGRVVDAGSGPDDAAVYSRDGTTLAVAGRDGDIRLWDVRTGTELGRPIDTHGGRVWSVAFSPNGKLVASGGKDGKVRLWSVATHDRIGRPFVGHDGTVWSIAFSPNGLTLVSGGADHTVRLWNVRTHGQRGPVLGRHGKGVNWVAFSPDGHTVASAGNEGQLRLWNVDTRKPVGRPIKVDADGVNAVAFSPDGHILATAGVDGDVDLWSVRTHKQLYPTPAGHTDTAFDVAFSPDGHTLASSGADGTVRLWDMQTHQELGAPLRGHSGYVFTVAFSPDGRALASTGQDGTVRLWEGFLLPWNGLAYLRDTVCSIVGRTLTKAEWSKFAPGIRFPKEPVCP
jgi:WD40 repeat protein